MKKVAINLDNIVINSLVIFCLLLEVTEKNFEYFEFCIFLLT